MFVFLDLGYLIQNDCFHLIHLPVTLKSWLILFDIIFKMGGGVGLDMVAHVCDPRIWEAELGEPIILGLLIFSQ